MTSLAGQVRPAAAQEIVPIHFSLEEAGRGKTVKLANGAELGIFPGALPDEADVRWDILDRSVLKIPDHINVAGSAYRLQITGVTTLGGVPKTLAVALPTQPGEWRQQIYQYDMTTTQWTGLPSRYTATSGKIRASINLLDGMVAVVNVRTEQTGAASWYCKNHCSSRYPTLHAASNDFPMGSYVMVTALDTKKSVRVKVVSTWGKPSGRVIDLSWPAFAALGSKNQGLTKVTVSPAPIAPVVSTTSKGVSKKIETVPNLQVVASVATPAPAITAKSYMVYDQTSGTILQSNQPDLVLPMASLTKLMTAMVYLDTKPDLKRTVVTYTAADRTGYDYLRVQLGDKMTSRDLLYSMLVASANNAATMLARSTGLTNTQFVARMNAKAKSWGLTNTTYADTSGLNPGNTTTAHDMAIIAGHAFHDYEPIRFVSNHQSYSFKTLNTKRIHNLKTTNKLTTTASLSAGLTVTGWKTGFIDEAKYTYVMRTKNVQGAQIIAVVLGAPTSAQRFQDAAQLTNWTFANYHWT